MSENTSNPVETPEFPRNDSASQDAGCSCCSCGGEHSAATPAEANASAAASTETESEKRKGFHPALVIATIVVVLFVLWFCPSALMRARIPANEAAAAVTLLTVPDLVLLTPEQVAMRKEVLVEGDLDNIKSVSRNYVVKKIRHQNGGRIIALVPKYYGESAKRAFCFYQGKVYSQDFGANPTDEQIAAPETSMKLLSGK